MLELVKHHRFSADAKKTIDECIKIVQSYQSQKLKLTLRQLYYQLVTRNAIRNEEKQYKRLSTLLSDARLAGIIDWEAIEDRIRVPRMPPEFHSLDELVEAALNSYRLPRWEGQGNYVELWVEKDALAGILQPLARAFHVPMMINRGYSSQTAMYDAAKRFINACYENVEYESIWEKLEGEKKQKECEHMADALKTVMLLKRQSRLKLERNPILFYLGDHDPSGEDMVRDIHDRLLMFGIDVDVRKLALTMDQVEEHDPPPNPAKMTDPRAREYMDQHGDMSWEVDALPPDVLNQIIRDAFKEVIDREIMDGVLKREEADKRALAQALASIRKKRKR